MGDDFDPLPPETDCDPALVDRMLAGEATSDDEAQFETWGAGHPEQAAAILRLRDGLVARHAALAFPTGSDAVQRVAGALDAGAESLGRGRMEGVGKGARRTSKSVGLGRQALRQGAWTRYAGLLLAAGGMVSIAVTSHWNDVSREPSMRTYATRTGERATVLLRDGTQVVLAPQTELRIPTTFGHSLRSVELVGQAVFDVRESTGTPFLVRTGKVTTRVLGTRFEVTRYAQDVATRVIVVQGKVQTGPTPVLPGVVPLTLVAGMVGHITDSLSTSSTVGNAEAYTNWTKGYLDFQNVPVPEMLATVERWYGIQFSVADSTILRGEVTGRFETRSASAVLEYVKTLLDVSLSFDRRGDTTVVMLHRRPSHRTPSPARRDLLLTPSLEVGR